MEVSKTRNKYKSEYLKRDQGEGNIPFFVSTLAFFGFALLFVFGYFIEFLQFFRIIQYQEPKDANKGFQPLFRMYDRFFQKHLFRRINQCWFRPISGCAGAITRVLLRTSNDNHFSNKLTGEYVDCINIGSYNYLGFGKPTKYCRDNVVASIENEGLCLASSSNQYGKTFLHEMLEQELAEYLGVEDVALFGMGFATNACNVQALMGAGCAIFSDQNNHASIVFGCRLAGCKIYVFNHNDMDDLEEKLRTAIYIGQPGSGEPWKKIMILFEGLYSMEGTFCDLARLVELKKKYKVSLFMDEAHSIGAVGETGRGMAEYFGIDPSDIDLFMGTFSKSFGACGGYIGGSKDVIDYLRQNSYCNIYGNSLAPPIVSQVLSVLRTLNQKDPQEDGQLRIKRLKENTRYIRKKLSSLGLLTLGHIDSPVVPILLMLPGIFSEFSQFMLKRGIAVVIVGFPATTLTGIRARVCISSEHTREMLDKVISSIDEFKMIYNLDYRHICFKYHLIQH